MKLGTLLVPFAIALTITGASASTTPSHTQPGYQAAVSEKKCKLSAVMHADTEFSAVERQSIKTAVDTWRMQTDGVACLLVVYDLDFHSVDSLMALQNANLIIRMDSGSEAARRFDEDSGAKVLGLVMPPGGVRTGKPTRLLLVADRLHEEPGQLHKVALHELGHVFGMGHSEQSWSVMYPAYSKDTPGCLQDVDLNEFCRITRCEGHTMQSCE